MRRRRALGRVHLGVMLIFAAAYLPLLVNELTTGGSEVRAALEYLAAGRAGSEMAIPVRFVIVGLRILSWPLTGLITDGFLAGVAASAAVIAIAVWRSRADGPDRLAARWLGLGLLWSTAFLTVTAPSLASVVPGLPNDHYHAFADPMVVHAGRPRGGGACSGRSGDERCARQAARSVRSWPVSAWSPCWAGT